MASLSFFFKCSIAFPNTLRVFEMTKNSTDSPTHYETQMEIITLNNLCMNNIYQEVKYNDHIYRFNHILHRDLKLAWSVKCHFKNPRSEI